MGMPEYSLWFVKSLIPITIYLTIILIIAKFLIRTPELKTKTYVISAFFLLLMPFLLPFIPSFFSQQIKVTRNIKEVTKFIPEDKNLVQEKPFIEKEKQQNIILYFSIFWLLGAIGFISYFLFSYLYLRNFWYPKQEKVNEEWQSKINAICRDLGIKKNVDLRFSQDNVNPSVFGFFSACVVFPKEMITRFSWQDLKPIFVHELSHVMRKDTEITFLRIALRSIYFFHPLVWLFLHSWHLSSEMACDKVVVRQEKNANDYAKSIVNFLEWQIFTKNKGTLIYANHFSYLKKRLSYILSDDIIIDKRERLLMKYCGWLLLGFCLAFWGQGSDNNNIVQVQPKENVRNTIKMPALHISSYETEDPVEKNNTTTYVIEVRNEGTAPCHDLFIMNKIPDESEFVSAQPVFIRNHQEIIFTRKEALLPGDKVIFKIKVKMTHVGSAINQTIVRYREFSKFLQVEEGTTVYQP